MAGRPVQGSDGAINLIAERLVRSACSPAALHASRDLR